MISSVDSNNSKICKIGNDSKYANNCKIGIHLALLIRKTGITNWETESFTLKVSPNEKRPYLRGTSKRALA
ncbi:hypothetical protein ACFLT1_01185 [Bacteroidota bacterium]